MRKIVLLFASIALLIASCKKDVHLLTKEFITGAPEVRIDSAYWVEDTLIVKSSILSEGLSPLVFAGICMKKDSLPSLRDNQVLTNAENNSYTLKLYGFIPYDTMYIRPIAGNDHGYTIGDAVKVIVPYPGPPTVPCALPPNAIQYSIYDYGVNYTFTLPFATYGEVDVMASCSGGPELHFYFNHNPTNGIYTTNTVSSFEDNPAHVYVEMNTGFNVYHMQPGGKVYVVENSDSTYTITFCDLTFIASTTEFTLKGSFVVD